MKSKLLAPILTLLAAASVQGAVVLTIDISNPSSVVFTSVANNSLIAGNLVVDFGGGISLRNFFTQNESILAGLAIGGDWKSRGANSPFDEMVTFVFNNAAIVAGVDLSIYHSVLSADDQNLLATEAPFTGSSVVNMAGLTYLPDVGTTGDVHLGYLASQGGVIGQWEVIPEPSAGLLGMLGTVVLLRRRR